MKYSNICEGKFIERLNRFEAIVEIDNLPQLCHVKNTGRCKELLVKGYKVYLQKAENPKRKTLYDLIAVQKGERLINMDSQAPNKAVKQWLEEFSPFGENMTIIPEKTYENSRFDFYLYSLDLNKKIFLEVKGCTLEENGIVMFPDAPTQRGVKHINELIKCTENGLGAAIMILVQMKDVKYFTPNYKTHPQFAQALKKAQSKGVEILCRDCKVKPDLIEVADAVEIKL